jgi:hypothetical protein
MSGSYGYNVLHAVQIRFYKFFLNDSLYKMLVKGKVVPITLTEHHTMEA